MRHTTVFTSHSYNCRLAEVTPLYSIPNWALVGEIMVTQSICFSEWASHLANPQVTSSGSTPDSPWGHAPPRGACMIFPEGVERRVRTRNTHLVSGIAILNPELHGLQCLSSPITTLIPHVTLSHWHHSKSLSVNVTPDITSFTSH